MTIKNLKIDATNGTNAWAVHLWNSSNNNAFNTCTLTCPNNGTGTNQIPLSISNSSTSISTAGNGGNNNIWDDCIISGGYYGVYFYGLTSTPFSVGNKIIYSQIIDFYLYGFYSYYHVDLLLSNNIFERMNRTTVTTTYGVFLSTNSLRTVIEKNHFRRFFNAVPTNANLVYGVYIGASSTANNEILVRNNVFSDMRSNGSLYMIYNPGYNNVFIDHNTISLDDISGSNTAANTVYGIYTTATPGRILNNLISITRSGPGTKYGLYYGTTTTFTSNGNVVFTANGANYGWVTAARATHALWKANTPYDAIGSDVDPIYTNTAALNYVPTNTLINNIGVPTNIVDDKINVPRSPVMPDPGAYEMYNNSCSGPPIAGTVLGPTVAICPGMAVNLQLNVNQYLFSGYSLQWQASTLAIAGFTSVPSATMPTQGFTPAHTTYYTALVTCTNNNVSTAAIPLGITVIAPTNTSVPYHEGFETLAANKLPNCGWSSSNMSGGVSGGTTLTYSQSSTNGRYPRTGSGFGSFYFTPSGQNYFYTNGIQLHAGVTYSASVWFVTEATGSPNFTDLSIMVGQTQTPASQKVVASTNGPAISVIYKQLSDTFQVSASGIYYVAVRATSTVGTAQYLSWDDLEITIPCKYNGPPMMIGSPAPPTICGGQSIVLNAAGASSYTWSTGQNGNTITATAPQVLNPTSFDFSVTGLNAISGCTATLAHHFTVNPSPQVNAVANQPAACQGKPIVLSAFGAGTYMWAHGAQGPVTTVTPAVNTVYSVNGTNIYNCISTGTVLVVVNPNPTIFAAANSTAICAGEDVQLDATGAMTYNWVSSTGGVYSGATLNLKPGSSAVYTVTGTDGNGCSKSAMITVAVNECTGLNEQLLNGLELFPNPVHESLNLKFPVNSVVALKLYDIAGKVVYSSVISSDYENINLSGLKSGVYSLNATTKTESKTFKIVKLD
jgi:hypothetical protein